MAWSVVAREVANYAIESRHDRGVEAERHRDIVRRFGRFPHDNAILGRAMTAEEQRYLDEGGYAG